MKNLFNTITLGLVSMSNAKDNFIKKLIKSNTGVSSKNFFLVATTMVSILMLVVVVIGILTDIWFNHTITVNMSDIATYIGAIAAMMGSAGITKAWGDWSENKYLSGRRESSFVDIESAMDKDSDCSEE